MRFRQPTHLARHADGEAPNLEEYGSSLYMVSLAAAGAVSRKSIVQTEELPDGEEGGRRTVMNPPPPMPDLYALNIRRSRRDS